MMKNLLFPAFVGFAVIAVGCRNVSPPQQSRENLGAKEVADSKATAKTTTFLPDRCGFAGGEGKTLVSDLDETGKHPIVGIDAYLEKTLGFGDLTIVGLRLRRVDRDSMVIGRTTDTSQSVAIPQDSFLTALGLNFNWGAKRNLITIYVTWNTRSGSGRGSKFLGTPMRTTVFQANYRRFPTEQNHSCFEITGLEGYVDQDNTLRSLAAVRAVRPTVGRLVTAEQIEGPAGLPSGMNTATDSTSKRLIFKVSLWSDDGGLYGVQISHCKRDGTDQKDGRILGFPLGTRSEFPIDRNEYITEIGGKIDSIGVRTIVMRVFNSETGESRPIIAGNNQHWRNANDFMFRLPKGTNGLPSARIYGFHGWVRDSRIGAIGPQYASQEQP